MRCSSCEILLDRYVEGTLSARQMADVTAHLRMCASCEALVTELRVVDALLATTKRAELAPNFTFAVMADARGLTIAPQRSVSMWAMLTFYLVAAWMGFSGVYVAFGGNVPWIGTALGTVRSGFTEASAAVSGAAQGIGPAAPVVFSLVAAVLFVDVLLAAVVLVFYRTIRPRLVARLARSESP